MNNQKKKTTTILVLIITASIFISVGGQSAFAGSTADNTAIGFQDGLKDCRSGSFNHINSHSNAGHHSAAYIKGYNQGLNSCVHSSSITTSKGNGNQITGTDNHNHNNRNQGQSQVASPHFSCFVLIGKCGSQIINQGQSLTN